jgi:hypothetical protein
MSSRLTTTLGADYGSPKRKGETADRFNFSPVKTFSTEAEGGIREPVYVPDSPRFSPIEPQSESMLCMSQHLQAVQEFIAPGEVFAVITPGDEPLQIRPDVACRVVPKGSPLARAMMVIQMGATHATFSADAQTLARDILDKMNAKSSSSSGMGWIFQARKKYSLTFRSFLDATNGATNKV